MKTQKLSVFFMACIMFCACSKESPEETKVEQQNVSSTDKTFEQPSTLISLEDAKQQLDNYNNAHPQEVGSEYALRTWISIEELKKYIAYIEKESADKGIEVSGIDFIHTQYNKALPGSPNANNSVYDKTLMMAPTYRNGNMNVAFDPIYSEKGKPKHLQELFDEIKKDSLLNERDSKPGGSSIANNMQSCPNNCTSYKP